MYSRVNIVYKVMPCYTKYVVVSVKQVLTNNELQALCHNQEHSSRELITTTAVLPNSERIAEASSLVPPSHPVGGR